MTLAAQTVVDLVAAAVRTATGYSSSGHTDRAWPLDESELPAAVVIADGEEIETATVHGPALEIHDLDVVVKLRVKAASSLDDAMHSATALVLTALYGTTAANARLAAGVQSFSTLRIDRDMSEHGQAKVGAVDITLRARFAVLANAPETIVF